MVSETQKKEPIELVAEEGERGVGKIKQRVGEADCSVSLTVVPTVSQGVVAGL